MSKHKKTLTQACQGMKKVYNVSHICADYSTKPGKLQYYKGVYEQ